MKIPEIRTVNVTRYITPLREGGSLPGIVEADDEFFYVLKFRGAGQGTKALIADLIGAEIARYLGMRVPELVFAMLHEAFGRTEPDEEIQDLFKFSTGRNLGVHFLTGAIAFDPAVNVIDPALASQIVWLDALLMNIDRTPKNTNMLMWNRELWLIDHGAALYFHHSWENWKPEVMKPFPMIKDHVLLPYASELPETDRRYAVALTDSVIDRLVSLIPEDWLGEEPAFQSKEEHRAAYGTFLKLRVRHSDIFLNEALHARERII